MNQIEMEIEDNELIISDNVQRPESKHIMIVDGRLVPSWDMIEEGHLLLMNTRDSEGWFMCLVDCKFDNFIGVIDLEDKVRIIRRGDQGGSKDSEYNFDTLWYVKNGELIKSGKRKIKKRKRWYKRTVEEEIWTFKREKNS